MNPYPKSHQTRKPKQRVDWSGFADPKGGKTELKGAAYTKLKKQVFDRDGNRCVICGSTWQLDLGHIIRRSKLRLDTPENTSCQCRKCNREQETGHLKVEWNGVKPKNRWRRTNTKHKWKWSPT